MYWPATLRSVLPVADGEERAIGLDKPSRIQVLIDGTVYVVNPQGYAVGFGAGQQREWIVIER